MKRAWIAAAGWLVAATALAQTAPSGVAGGLPVAEVRPVTDVYHGVSIVDPYRHFEQPQAPEVAAWMKAHSDHAHATLRALPERAAFRARLVALEQSRAEAVTRVQRSADGRLFYLGREPGDDQFKLVVREPGSRTPKVLFDPMVLARATGKPHGITGVRPSPNGLHFGVIVSPAGSEAGVLHVLDSATGEPRMPPLDRADFALPGWIDDHRFIIQRLKALAPDAPATEKYRDIESELVHLASAPGGAAHQVLPARRELQVDPATEVVVRAVDGERRTLAFAFDGVRNEVAIHLADGRGARGEPTQWQRVASVDDGVVDFAVQGHTLYGLSHRGAPRFQVLAWDLRQPTRAARVVLPTSDRRVLQRVIATRDALYVLAREGNAQSLLRVPHGGGRAQPVALPLAGSVFVDSGWGKDLSLARQSGLVIGLQGWTRAIEYHAVTASGPVRPLQLPVLGPEDAPADLESVDVLVPSHDGAPVPMSLVYRKGLKRDGRAPVWLTAYAAYGFTINPSYRRERLAWLERGGVLAFANPRGSGVYGRQWHEAGKGPTKRNSWLDVIACAEYLVREGWTRPQHLGFSGRSAGGLLAGRVLTARPDLFGAFVLGVGVHDMLRTETAPNGPPNIPEFGSVATEAGFKALLEMSPYAQVKDGTAYPPVLLTHGVNDPRVEVWASTKMAARLMAASSSGQPVLLRLDYDAGHGVGDTATQQIEENADTYAFLWHHLTRGR